MSGLALGEGRALYVLVLLRGHCRDSESGVENLLFIDLALC
jgi:hypothetical protein